MKNESLGPHSFVPQSLGTTVAEADLESSSRPSSPDRFANETCPFHAQPAPIAQWRLEREVCWGSLTVLTPGCGLIARPCAPSPLYFFLTFPHPFFDIFKLPPPHSESLSSIQPWDSPPSSLHMNKLPVRQEANRKAAILGSRNISHIQAPVLR
ncbi:hypothetical protein CC78DRAFT_580080 [Lojkania enalia]|uniref:Uncharacterized protein n=1 Tax=Lojkania enalia TaxID=147567 RepID=A0A9P4N4J4_9PLEO|nr:hypothetical protein CC78DRAFT_580080 [Didymosphaeria enalia]